MGNRADGLGGAPNINIFVARQIEKLKKCEQTFKSVFDFMFLLEDNVMAEDTDGNRIFSVSYGECKKRILSISPQVKELFRDVPKNSIIGIYMDNCLEWIEIFWAVLRCGFVPLLMNKRLGKDILQQVISDNDVKGVITDGEVFGVLSFNYKDAYCDNKNDFQEDWANEIIFMSSGTSLNVKLCVYSGEKICQQIYNSEEIVKESKEIQAHLDGKLKQLTFLPFYHVFGFLACYMWFAFFARTFVFLKNYNSDTILKTIKKHKVTHIFAVPMLWKKIEDAAMKAIAERGEKTEKKFEKGLKISMMLQNMGLGKRFAKSAFKEVRENIFGDSVLFMISGGGHIPSKTLSFFNGIGYRLVNGFGMTEVGITSVNLNSKPKKIINGSVGRPFKSIKYKIVDGELAISGKSLASLIISNGERKIIRNDEWFMSEDNAENVGEDWFLSGRRDDMIVTSAGENIRPEKIESVIDVSGAEAILLGIEKDDLTVRATLLVSMTSNREPQEVKKEIISILEKNQLQGLVEDIKMTYSPLLKGTEFKINRKRIKRDILSGSIVFIDERKESSDSFTDEIKLKVIEIFEKALGKSIREGQYDLNFFYELEGSSLSYFEVVEAIKKNWGIDILSSGEALYSVNEVYNHINKKQIKL